MRLGEPHSQQSAPLDEQHRVNLDEIGKAEECAQTGVRAAQMQTVQILVADDGLAPMGHPLTDEAEHLLSAGYVDWTPQKVDAAKHRKHPRTGPSRNNRRTSGIGIASVRPP